MKTVIIHGQSHKGSTYHIANQLAEKIGGDLTEFFLPRDFDEFCVGCTMCFMESEEKCPHYGKLQPLTRAMAEADVIIKNAEAQTDEIKRNASVERAKRKALFEEKINAECEKYLQMSS